jgi:hypothetical protein
MAIKIDIPGFGDVTVEGVAEESTMRDILAQLKKNEQIKQTDQRDLNNQQKEQAKHLKNINGELGDMEESLEDLDAEFDKLEKAAAELDRGFTKATKAIGGNLYQFGKDLSLTAASVTTAWMTQYDSLADNPIKASSEMINTSLELLEAGLKKTLEAASGVSGGLLGMIPVIGDGAARLADTAKDVGKGVVEAGVTITQAMNKVLAAELEKRTQALVEFSTAGASFAGGMAEMGTIANESGLGISDLAKVVKGAREDIYRMGMTASDGTMLLGKGLSGLANTVGRSGNTLRNELLALGYSYQEQGEILAQFSSQRQSEGRLQGMTQQELALGTQEYAKNLKVISDLTGKDAKQLMDKARDESLRASLMASLSGDQLEAFKQAYAQLETLGPNVQRAFVQKLATGTTNIASVAASRELSNIVNGVTGAVRSGTKDIASETQNLIAENAKQARASVEGYGRAVDTAALMGSQQAAQFAEDTNRLLTYMLPEGAAKASKERADQQMTATDGITKGFQTATEETKKFQVAMETLTGQILNDYGKVIGETVKTTANLLEAAMDLLRTGDYKAFANRTGMGGAASPAGNLTGLPGDKRTTAQKAQQDADVRAGRKSYNALGFDQPNIDPYEMAARKGKAKGGISTGPLSGYQETLHGTEAVVPLPDNRSIPVSLDSGLATSIERNNSLLSDIIKVLKEGNSNTSLLVRNTA